MSGSTDAEIVSFLETLGVRPGVEVVVVEKHPFDGPLVVEVEATPARWASGWPGRSM